MGLIVHKIRFIIKLFFGTKYGSVSTELETSVSYVKVFFEIETSGGSNLAVMCAWRVMVWHLPFGTN